MLPLLSVVVTNQVNQTQIVLWNQNIVFACYVGALFYGICVSLYIIKYKKYMFFALRHNKSVITIHMHAHIAGDRNAAGLSYYHTAQRNRST